MCVRTNRTIGQPWPCSHYGGRGLESDPLQAPWAAENLEKISPWVFGPINPVLLNEFGVVIFIWAIYNLGGGLFKHFLFSPRTLGFHDSQFDEHIFQGGWNHQLVYVSNVNQNPKSGYYTGWISTCTGITIWPSHIGQLSMAHIELRLRRHCRQQHRKAALTGLKIRMSGFDNDILSITCVSGIIVQQPFVSNYSITYSYYHRCCRIFRIKKRKACLSHRFQVLPLKHCCEPWLNFRFVSIHPNHPRMISKVKAMIFCRFPEMFAHLPTWPKCHSRFFWGESPSLQSKSDVFGWRTQQL